MNGPTVKTSRPYKNDFVEDGIVLVDCTKTCHQLGLCRYRIVYLWCVKDVCGIICAVFTWLLVLYAEFVVMLVMLLPGPSLMYSFINAVLYNIFAFLAVAAHLRTMFTDPGAIPKGNATRENILKMGLKQGEVIFKCPKCVSIKPDRAHHCSVCQRCIRKMDHHCPWVNNCVGENNQKYFVLFTFYICLISCYSLCLAINHFIVCVGKDWKDNLQFDGLISLPDAHATHSIPLALKIFSHMIGCSSYSPPSVTIMLIILIFEGLLFGIFTAIMLGSQLSAICTDETGIEQLKKEQTSWKKKSRWLSIKAVFGHPFSLSWFSPFSAPRVGKHEDYYLHSV